MRKTGVWSGEKACVKRGWCVCEENRVSSEERVVCVWGEQAEVYHEENIK